MIAAPKCFERQCKHYLGVSQPDGTEMTERCVCRAFPQGIPDDIVLGKNLHKVPTPEQENDIVFEKE